MDKRWMGERLRVFSCATVLLSVTGGAFAAAATPLPLSTLEAKIPASPGLRADEQDIAAAAASVQVEQDKSGLAYTVSGAVGPESIIVPRSYNDQVFRFAQDIGLRAPMVGSRITQELSVLDAQEREQIVRIEFNQAGRDRLAQLRSAYVQYWQYDRQGKIASDYLTAAQQDRSQATGLRRNGFLTETDLFDFSDAIDRVKADADMFATSQRAQLAQIGAAVGSEVGAFFPLDPTYFARCNPDRTRALESAYKSDALLAELDAQLTQAKITYQKVGGSSIEGAATAVAGTDTNLNQQVSGYHVLVGVNLSLPTRAHSEERAARAKYAAEVEALSLHQQQRKVELAASVDALIDDLSAAGTALAQASTDRDARSRDAKTAILRQQSVSQEPQAGFADVYEKRVAYYLAARDAAAAQAQVWLKASALLLAAPGTCGASYEPMPGFAIPGSHR